MQISEKCRRGIVLPLSRSTEKEVRNYSVSERSKVEVLGLKDDHFFFKIFELFREINNSCSTMIDDYENELVEPEKIPKILTVIDVFLVNNQECEINDFLEELIALLNKAKS